MQSASFRACRRRTPSIYIISTMYPQEKFAERLLGLNLRPDGREPLQQRQRKVLFMSSRGHLLFVQGGTSVIVKTKIEITAPKNQRPSEGNVYFRVDCTSCNASNEEQRKFANQAAKLLQTVVVGSKALDPESLCILSGRYVWKVTIECLIVSDDGNILDCLLNGTILSLMDVRKPLIRFQKEKLEVEEDVQQALSLAHLPISLTLALTGNNLIADPIASEERVSKSRITVTMNVYKELCSVHKPGGMGISQQTLSGCVKLAEQRVKLTTDWMRNILKQRPLFDSSF